MDYTVKGRRYSNWKAEFAESHVSRAVKRLGRLNWKRGNVIPFVPDRIGMIAEELHRELELRRED